MHLIYFGEKRPLWSDRGRTARYHIVATRLTSNQRDFSVNNVVINKWLSDTVTAVQIRISPPPPTPFHCPFSLCPTPLSPFLIFSIRLARCSPSLSRWLCVNLPSGCASSKWQIPTGNTPHDIHQRDQPAHTHSHTDHEPFICVQRGNTVYAHSARILLF